MSSWAPWRNLAGTTLAVAVLALSAGAAITALDAGAAGAAVAARGGNNAYTLSGAVSGTLHDGPTAGCPYGGINTKGFIELTDLVGTTSGIKGVASWSLDINVKKNGTFKFKALPIGDPTAELNVNLKNGNIAKGVADNFFADAGTVTVKGESGSISAPMRQASGGKTLKVVARWACGTTAAAQAVSGSGWKTPVLVAHAAASTAPPQFTGVSCPTASFCAAVDSRGSVALLSDGSWSSPQSIDSTATSDFNDTMGTVSCASGSFCVAGDNLDDVSTYDGSSWSAMHQLNAAVTEATVSFAVSCPTTSFCLAVDGDYNWYTYNGSTWSAAQVIDSNSLEGIVIGEVSCASATFCEAAFGRQTVTFNGQLVGPGHHSDRLRGQRIVDAEHRGAVVRLVDLVCRGRDDIEQPGLPRHLQRHRLGHAADKEDRPRPAGVRLGLVPDHILLHGTRARRLGHLQRVGVGSAPDVLRPGRPDRPRPVVRQCSVLHVGQVLRGSRGQRVRRRLEGLIAPATVERAEILPGFGRQVVDLHGPGEGDGDPDLLQVGRAVGTGA
jgi:hypothetical protein